MSDRNSMIIDRLEVADLIVRERLARDNRFWAEMASYYAEDSIVDVSWFRGSGADFVKASEGAVRPGNVSFHIMTPPVVTVRGERAISETPCMLRDFTEIDGRGASYEGFVKLFWRAVRQGADWKIAGLRCVYMRDQFHANNPSNPPHFDEEALRGYRASYRFLVANLANIGIAARDDLPGIDRPEVVDALRRSEEQWLADNID